MRAIAGGDLAAIAVLLRESGLPTDDVHELDPALFLVVGDPPRFAAVCGLERCGDDALLRSVATAPERRGEGLARQLVAALEALAVREGIAALYLLTESAEDFFASLGYAACDRATVPPAVRASRQFADLCPDSATVMGKVLRG